MLEVRKRREVKTLLQRFRPVVVARLTGVSLSSVKRIAKEPGILHLDDAAERRRRRIGRPSKVRGYRTRIAGLLDRSPEIRSVDVLGQVRLMGYAGGKTALYALVATLRREREHEVQVPTVQAVSAGLPIPGWGVR